jgi:hypothetical protein
MTYETILYEKRGPVVTLTLTGPRPSTRSIRR